jgi:acetoin utilization deacetylase AcuC-like enzyme
LILVSAGYDAHRDDPLADGEVTDAGYGTMAASIRAVADSLRVPVGVVLEGGYDLGALARGLVATLEVLGAEGPVSAPVLDVHPLSERYREKHAALLGA